MIKRCQKFGIFDEAVAQRWEEIDCIEFDGVESESMKKKYNKSIRNQTNQP